MPKQEYTSSPEHSGRSQDVARLEVVRATLRHAIENTYYKHAFAGIDIDIESLDDLRRFPLLSRHTLAECDTDLLTAGVVPEYVGITSGTTFRDDGRQPLLHYQTESEHNTWVRLYSSMIEGARGERPLMLRLIDADRGVEIAGAFPGCFSVPLQNLYHFELILAILGRKWSFAGFSERVLSLSGPLDLLQLVTLLCLERDIDPSQFKIGVISSSGWQITSRWRGLLSRSWCAEIQELYGLSEAPGMFATRCAHCSHYHFSPLALIEVLRLDSDVPVTSGVGRVVVTCLLPLAQAQPIIRYDTQDVINIVGSCGNQMSFEYLGRCSKLVLIDDANGSTPILSSLVVTDVLDLIPDVAVQENAKAKLFGLQTGFGWPRYSLSDQTGQSGRHLDLTVGLRWSPSLYPEAARKFREALLRRVFDASPALEAAVERADVSFDVQLAGPGAPLRALANEE